MALQSKINWKSFDTYIFDLDGTLVDSLYQIESALDTTRINFGYKKTPNGQVFAKLGMPLKHLFSDIEMSPNAQAEFIAFFRNELANQISISNQLFTSSADLIKLLRNFNIRVAIATSKPTYLANLVIENSEISGIIDFIQGTDDFPPKPNPEVIRKCITALKSESAIMIGDRIEDIEAGLAAGIPAIGIAQSAHSEQKLAESGAELTFANIDLLYKCILTS